MEVLQGSCLGPLLYLVYINDLPCIIKNPKVSMYADNTSLYHFSKDISQLNEPISEDLGKIDRWLKGNKLSLNVTKTHSMLSPPNIRRTILRFPVKLSNLPFVRRVSKLQVTLNI